MSVNRNHRYLFPLEGGPLGFQLTTIHLRSEMKRSAKILIAFVIIVIAGAVPAVCAQVLSTNHVPAKVRQAFRAKFPAVRFAAWKIKSDGDYEAEFTLKRKEIAAKFDVSGKWIETESAIPRSQLPTALSAAIAQEFKGYKIVETQTLQRWDETRLIYEVHLENAAEIVKLQLYSDGTILNRSAKEMLRRKESVFVYPVLTEPATLHRAA